MLQMKIGETSVQVEWEDNESVQALRELCFGQPLTIRMSMYGGFEQVGAIGEKLPRNDRQTTTNAGDIVLYSGSNCRRHRSLLREQYRYILWLQQLVLYAAGTDHRFDRV